MKPRERRALSERLGHLFADEDLLEQALRHPSFTHESPKAGPHNQRLEFLGDAVLGLVVAEALLARFPDAREGELTRWRAALVSEQSLAATAQGIGLGDRLVLGRGEEAQGGRSRPSVLCDGLEAVVGATFLDGGLAGARRVVLTLLGDRIASVDIDAPMDHKSRLQEIVQSGRAEGPVYSVVAETGPDHDKRFVVELRLGERLLARAEGTTKKGAEQAAACKALETLDERGAQ